MQESVSMNKKKICKRFLLYFSVMMFLLALGCSGGGGGGSDDSNNNTYQEPAAMAAPVTKQQSVDVELPASSSLNNEALKVISFYGESQVPTKAKRLYKTIPITITDTTKGQIVILADSLDNPLFFSYIESTTGTATINSEGIAKALLWMNPYVLILPADQKKIFMEQAVKSTLFPQLKDKIDNMLVSDPKNLLNPDLHPEIIKTSFALVKETFEVLGTQQSKVYKDIGESGDLRMLDKSSNDVSFENPKMVSYGIEIIDANGKKTNVFLEGKDGLVSIKWGWKKFQIATKSESDPILLQDGQYNVTYYKGFNTDVTGWWKPIIPKEWLSPIPANDIVLQGATIVGTATWANAFDTFGILVENISGLPINKKIGIGRIAKEAANINGFIDFANAIRSGDTVGALEATITLLSNKDNWVIIAKAIWGNFGPDSQTFLHMAKVLVKNIAKGLKVVDWINHDIPFFYDLAFAPSDPLYCITSTNGVLNECSGVNPIIPPTASLTVSPIYPYIGDTVTFDASGSTDDTTTALKYRFDYDGDGTWDTTLSVNGTATYSYSSTGTYNAKVEVKDGDGQTAIASYYVTVYDISQGISSAIVIDRSGSMDYEVGKMENAKAAAKTYVNYMGTADRGMVIDFDDVVTPTQAYTGDKSLLITAIDSLYARNATAFFDAVYMAIAETAKEDASRRRAVVALTDGLDNSSVYKKDIDVSLKKLQDIVDYAQQQGISVYTIGLGSDADSVTLNDLASQTNGLYFYAPDSSQLQNIYDTIRGIK